MELADNQTLLLSNFHFPEQVYVNVESKKDFHVLRQTIIGSHDLRQYGLGNIGAYIEELWDVLTIYYYLEDATKSLVLWRSSSTVPLPLPNFKAFGVQWVKVGVPLHSMLAFLLATSLVENLELVPSFSFGCIVWMMIATLEMRAHNPNPWKRSQRLSRLLYSLVIGKNISSARAIEPNENLDAIKRAEEMWKERLKDAKEKAEKRALQYQKEQEQYWQEMAELEADADIGTKLGGLSFDPTKAWLLPIQQWLGIICESLRVVRNVIYWEEPYISFWITLGCLLLSLLFYFVPWGFVVRWTLRIVGMYNACIWSCLHSLYT
jgi:F0F1-type ATP synthase assembly protein I